MTAKDRKRAIVAAALPLFARRGYAETTTKDLARAAGVSQPLLYKHFPGKQALYREILKFSRQDDDRAVQKLAGLKPSSSTLVYLVYYLMRALVLGKPVGVIAWDTRHRLMLKSLLEDGAFARMVYRSRFDCYCSRMEACLEAAIAAGDAVKSPLTPGNRARFAYHVGAWLALVHLPPTPAINYRVSREKLLDQCAWFVLRGMGLTDQALATFYNPGALALFFQL
ncbi:MAG: helix-turn-helix domain-containing protein [Verrucomicrobiota bacterium]